MDSLSLEHWIFLDRFSAVHVHWIKFIFSLLITMSHLLHCRINLHFIIKISDFGLSEDVYSKNYFRQGGSDNSVKLPVKWMAPESLNDGIFSEKTDVVSFKDLPFVAGLNLSWHALIFRCAQMLALIFDFSLACKLIRDNLHEKWDLGVKSKDISI